MAETDGVCAIVPWGQAGLRPKVLGMGILTGKREIVTCAHVVKDAAVGGKVRVCFPFSAGLVCVEGEVDRARVDGGLDIAVI